VTVAGVLTDFAERYDDAESRKYLHTHSHRYETLLRFVREPRRKKRPPAT